MTRYFNTAGPCDPARHYMLPPERRLPEVGTLIERELYFVLHAPRQTGKTTSIRTLARRLTEEGRYGAVVSSCEGGQAVGGDLEKGITAVLEALTQAARSDLPESLWPPSPDPSVSAATRLHDLLARWSRSSSRPVVLFLDEIDALRDEALLSVLRQLRAGYATRSKGFPQSVALIGLRDVRDYRIHVRAESESLGTSSPFNIKVTSLTLRNFTEEEVAELYGQHTEETGQPFRPEAVRRCFELTRGQPWLVNALAAEIVDKLVPDRSTAIERAHVEAAKERLILRRDTHLDSLIDRLREGRVRRVIEPILAGELLSPDLLDDDVQFVMDLGLVTSGPAGLEIANPIYREVIPRALTWVVQEGLPFRQSSFLAADGSLSTDKILTDFRDFWCQNAEFFLERQPYSEAAGQLIFMAFLQKIVNGGGFIDREFGVGSGRIDLCVRQPYLGGVQRWALELKVWREGRPDPLPTGLSQLSQYLAKLGLDFGTLILFDARTEAASLPGRCSLSEVEHEGKRIQILRL